MSHPEKVIEQMKESFEKQLADKDKEIEDLKTAILDLSDGQARMYQKHQAELTKIKKLLREVVMRSNCALPQTPEDTKWFDEQFSESPVGFMINLFKILGLGEFDETTKDKIFGDEKISNEILNSVYGPSEPPSFEYIMKKRSELKSKEKLPNTEAIREAWNKRCDYIKNIKNVRTDLIFEFFEPYFYKQQKQFTSDQIDCMAQDWMKGKEMYATYDAHITGFIKGFNVAINKLK